MSKNRRQSWISTGPQPLTNFSWQGLLWDKFYPVARHFPTELSIFNLRCHRSTIWHAIIEVSTFINERQRIPLATGQSELVAHDELRKACGWELLPSQPQTHSSHAGERNLLGTTGFLNTA
ncbi:hypothetical protein [Thalassoglobus sp.]|uniref:hypothetical protein n=1 Tax=Thalassoglobus sp. TaxID=2795869 RepID=UPI003AA89F65